MVGEQYSGTAGQGQIGFYKLSGHSLLAPERKRVKGIWGPSQAVVMGHARLTTARRNAMEANRGYDVVGGRGEAGSELEVVNV